MEKQSRNRYRDGFTLIEVMIVLFILVMIMGIGVVAVQGQRELARKRTALAYVKLLASAVDRYDGDVGQLPPTLEALLSPPEGLEGRWGGPYLTDNATSIDPWGNEYQYAVEAGKFRIWSFGPNMMDEGGSGDDIGNWMNDL